MAATPQYRTDSGRVQMRGDTRKDMQRAKSKRNLARSDKKRFYFHIDIYERSHVLLQYKNVRISLQNHVQDSNKLKYNLHYLFFFSLRFPQAPRCAFIAYLSIFAISHFFLKIFLFSLLILPLLFFHSTLHHSHVFCHSTWVFRFSSLILFRSFLSYFSFLSNFPFSLLHSLSLYFLPFIFFKRFTLLIHFPP